MTETEKPDLITREEAGVGFVVFNRPEQRNALTLEMYDGLAAYCAEPPENVLAIVISGTGGAFAAGTDMRVFEGFRAEDARDYERKMDRVLSRIEACPVPVIAAIDGACTGGGAAIACCADIRIATERLKFGVPIARTLGNCLSASNLARMARLIGPARVKELVLLARLVGAREAETIGLVSAVLPDGEALDAKAAELATTLTRMAPLTLRATKEAMRRNAAAQPVGEDADLIELCYTSEDFQEGRTAFLEKRKPEWGGR